MREIILRFEIYKFIKFTFIKEAHSVSIENFYLVVFYGNKKI
jgi:hypothetical protein